MKNVPNESRELIAVTLSDIEGFLYTNGWKKESQDNEKITSYLLPKNSQNSSYLKLVLPSSKDYIDYFERIENAINVLSQVHDKSTEEIIKEITSVNHDVFKARIINPSIYPNSIPLPIAVENIKAFRDLFIYSACSEEKNLPYFEKPLSVGILHANLCYFGHTFDGSFGFTINSPIDSDVQGLEFNQYSLIDNKKESTFERRVMERIVRGLYLVEEAVRKDDGDIVVNSYDTALNARMCKALLEISQGMQKDIEYNISWSPLVTLADDVKTKNNFYFSKACHRVLEYAESELNKIEPRVETIIGQVVTLHSNKNPLTEGDFTRQAVIKYEYDCKKICIKLDLNRFEYDIAYTAHGKGLPVKVTGTLFRKGNTWTMVDVTSLHMLIT